MVQDDTGMVVVWLTCQLSRGAECEVMCAREELEKQQAKERYEKLHLAGKTDEARADLARLALVRKQREEAAKKREEERKGKIVLYCNGKAVLNANVGYVVL